ncbi:hypothetical protein [Brumimicrobium mesophilum]|uniref:hypothetical protein n=1 Tax=Brumimicrobium mesophilum TaxID=392717 RepID=UPI000D13F750|nr:hypothetical protein [Brumimicrobium mesophilum]
MKTSLKYLSIFVVAIITASCSKKTEVTRGFYAWQSHYDVDEVKNQKLFQSFAGERLYLKMFEVTYDEKSGAIPVSKTNTKLHNEFMSNAELVPCVFIENEVLSKLSSIQLNELADNIIFLVNKYVDNEVFQYSAKNNTYTEIQLDCDWSKANQNSYFELIKLIKEKSQKTVSCTMRLYPYKYRDEMGTPPVDRIMLLCYNLLNPTKNTDKNSILEIEELKKYIDFDTPYPVPVDVALPAYSSGYRFDQQRFAGIFHAVPENFEEIAVATKDNLHFIVKEDTSINHKYFRKGEKIKIERISESVLLEAAELISNHINQSEMNVVIYHLDHEEIYQYKHEILDSVFSIFN